MTQMDRIFKRVTLIFQKLSSSTNTINIQKFFVTYSYPSIIYESKCKLCTIYHSLVSYRRVSVVIGETGDPVYVKGVYPIYLRMI